MGPRKGDEDEEDGVERLGRRVGRMLSALAVIVLIIYLALTYFS